MKRVLLICAVFSVLTLTMVARHSINAEAAYSRNNATQVVAITEPAVQEIIPNVTEASTVVAPVAPEPVYAVVAAGDSLTSIAQTHGTTTQRLYDANSEISDPSLLNIGQKIRIPLADEQLATRPMPVPAPKPVTVAKSNPTPSNAPAVASGSVWDQLSQCEAGGNWARNSGNGYYGGLQFSLSTWRAVGGQGLPSENSREEQIARAEILLARSGWGQWPTCARKLGLL